MASYTRRASTGGPPPRLVAAIAALAFLFGSAVLIASLQFRHEDRAAHRGVTREVAR